MGDGFQLIEGMPHDVCIRGLIQEFHNVRALSQGKHHFQKLILQRQHLHAVQQITPQTAAVITGMLIRFHLIHSPFLLGS